MTLAGRRGGGGRHGRCRLLAGILGALLGASRLAAGSATFTSSGTWTVPASVASVNVLVVAGGGAGSGNAGGGGGAGGVIHNTAYAVTPGATITVTVGAGGTVVSGYGNNGGNSSFGSLTAIGGGAGGTYSYGGASGGSGGGGGSGESGDLAAGAGGAGTSGQGYAGAHGQLGDTGGSPTPDVGGGGGGSGGYGTIDGGGGTYTVHFGTAYAAGGGGGGCPDGGTPGGGAGAGDGASGNASGGAAAPNSGSGGGGGGGYAGNAGGAGGSGIVIVTWVTPIPSITSSLAVAAKQNESINYTIAATGLPSSYAATDLPAGLSVNTSTGAITGHVTQTGTITSTITATNAYGHDTRNLVWTVQAASITASGGVSPLSIFIGDSVTLVRAGTTNFPFGWTENVIWRPVSGAEVLGNLGLGQMDYTPADGIGTYWYQFRVVDIYANYFDQWLSFEVTEAVLPPTSVSVTGSGSYSVSLGWSGADAAAGINHYNVYRDGSLIGSTTGTTYTDSTAAPGTAYGYTIKTVDNHGALSAASGAANVTTTASLEIFTPLP